MKKFMLVVAVAGSAIVSTNQINVKETSNGKPIRSFSTSKNILHKKIYNTAKLRKSFYCGCKYSARKTVSVEQCGYRPFHLTSRSFRIEWEHIVPASELAKDLPCSKSGRKHCRKVSREFRRREGDLHNLVPAIGEINLKRSNYLFGYVLGEPRMYGKCSIEIVNKVVEPSDNTKGEIARIWLYMAEKYNLNYPYKYIRMLKEWDKKYPVTNGERLKNKLVKRFQGDSNPYIEER